MKKFILILAISILCITPQFVKAQEEKPKVALVLSGGGAKGLAHIPVLQALDSLGIVPDIVIGTSMGSVVGGLYAMGYSGDSIAAITKEIDWDVILGGQISLQDVAVEEKSQYKKFLADFDLIKGRPKINSALLNDQLLREFISSLTYPVFNIDDFDDLAIPYRSMTTDIVNGKEVLLSKGSLGLAMRASMSIPGVFRPVPYNNTLLVDGGILNNFPVDVAKDMGYDIIIGSTVGGGMAKKEDLSSIVTLLFQASMLTSNLKDPESKEMCDILIDHVPHLSFGTGDFNKGNILYEEGKIATKEEINKLSKLADKLKGFKQRNHKIPDVRDAFVLDTVVLNNVSEGNIDLVRARAEIETNKEYSTQELIDGMNRVMGTTLFDQVTYYGVIDGDKTALHLNGFEHAKHQVKGSLHYDTYRGVGLIANYTGRNVLGKASRIFLTLDIAQQPKFRAQYQKIFGDTKKWWWRSDALGEQLTDKLFIAGDAADDMRFQFMQYDNQINFNLNSRVSYVGLGLNYEFSNIKPTVDPELSDNALFIDRYRFNNFEIYAHYVYSNTNKVFYATRGAYFKANLGRSLYHHVESLYSDNDPDDTPDVNANTNGFTKLGLNYEQRIFLNKKITGIVGVGGNFIFEDNLDPTSDEVSFTEYGYAAKYFLGGNIHNPRKNSFIFPGLREDELNVNQFTKLNLALQWNPINKIYLIPHYDLAVVGFGDFSDYIGDVFSHDGSWPEQTEVSTLMSAGATISYHSFLGPVNFDVSWVNDINKVRFFFSIGLLLN